MAKSWSFHEKPHAQAAQGVRIISNQIEIGDCDLFWRWKFSTVMV